MVLYGVRCAVWAYEKKYIYIWSKSKNCKKSENSENFKIPKFQKIQKFQKFQKSKMERTMFGITWFLEPKHGSFHFGIFGVEAWRWRVEKTLAMHKKLKHVNEKTLQIYREYQQIPKISKRREPWSWIFGNSKNVDHGRGGEHIWICVPYLFSCCLGSHFLWLASRQNRLGGLVWSGAGHVPMNLLILSQALL